jgi:hypothetical protein
MARVLARGVVQELSLGGHLQSKQGSELSSILFSLFIELPHHLIKLKLLEAGPVLSGLIHKRAWCHVC